MSAVNAQQLLPLLKENVWREATQYMEAETHFQEFCAKKKSACKPSSEVMTSSCKLVNEIALARQRIQNTLKDIGDNSYKSGDWMERIEALEKDNRSLSQKLEDLTIRVQEYTNRICTLEKTSQGCNQCRNSKTDTPSVLKSDNREEDEDDDVDLFGSDEETEEEKRIKNERVKAYEDKKSKKKQVIAKSSIVLDIKPWYDTTDLLAMEQEVRKIKNDGLKWGASSLIPIAYGIRKLQIVATVEDELVSVDWLQETIQDQIEALVQSVDVVAFNKL